MICIFPDPNLRVDDYTEDLTTHKLIYPSEIVITLSVEIIAGTGTGNIEQLPDQY